MNIDIKDEILTGEPRYRIRDNNGNILQDNVAIEKTTSVKQEATPINKKLFQDFYKDISPVGNIRLYSNIEDRPNALLCDGSAIFSIDYPKLKDKLIGYDVFQKYEDGSGFSNIKQVNNIFYFGGTEMNYSYDGIEWHTTTVPTGFVDITYDNGKYFALGNARCPVYYSEDFINWQFKGYADSSTSIYGKRIIYRKGVVVVTGDEGLLTYSTNEGTTFTDVHPSSSYSDSVQFLGYIKNNFVCQISGSGNKTVYNSENGTSWTQIASSSTVELLTRSSVDAKEEYIWRTNGHSLYRTQNGLDWELYKTYDITLGNRLYIDLNNIFYAWEYYQGSGTVNKPLNRSYDLESWDILTVEGDKGMSSDSTTMCASNNIGYVHLSSGKGAFIFYNDGSNKKLILPTKIDEANQIYGYINSEE